MAELIQYSCVPNVNVLGLFVKTLKIILNEKGLKKKPE